MPAADANPARAGFDWRAFARTIREAHRADGRGLVLIGKEIGVTSTDLSRAMGGANIDTGKVMAMCDWAGVDERSFYLRPEHYDAKTRRCTTPHVKHGDRETEGARASVQTEAPC